MSSNNSWYLNGDPEQGLNPKLKYVNSNNNEENRTLIKWANENNINLIDLEKYSVRELKQEQRLQRRFFRQLLSNRFDIEANNCYGHCWDLHGFGTLAEHKAYNEMYNEILDYYLEATAEDRYYKQLEAERESEELQRLQAEIMLDRY
jgi:hypothetical protein